MSEATPAPGIPSTSVEAITTARRNAIGRRLPLLALLVLVAIYLVIALFDVVFAGALMRSPVWFFLFREAHLVEMMQWILLGATALVAASSAAAERSSRDAIQFWRWFSVGMLLLLIEDAGNPSHTVRNTLEAAIPGLPYGFARLPIFVVLGAVLLYPIIRYRGFVLSLGPATRRLATGYVLYAMAAFASVPSKLLGSYEPIGAWLLSRPLLDRLPPLWGDAAANTNSIFVDTVIEESVELMAATFLLSGVLLASSRGSQVHQASRAVADGGV